MHFQQYLRPEAETCTPVGGSALALTLDRQDEEKSHKLHLRKMAFIKPKDGGPNKWVHTKDGVALNPEDVESLFDKAVNFVTMTLPAVPKLVKEFLLSKARHLGTTYDRLRLVEEVLEEFSVLQVHLGRTD